LDRVWRGKRKRKSVSVKQFRIFLKIHPLGLEKRTQPANSSLAFPDDIRDQTNRQVIPEREKEPGGRPRPGMILVVHPDSTAKSKSA